MTNMYKDQIKSTKSEDELIDVMTKIFAENDFVLDPALSYLENNDVYARDDDESELLLLADDQWMAITNKIEELSIVNITYNTKDYSVVEKEPGFGSFVGVKADGTVFTDICESEFKAHCELMKLVPAIRNEPLFAAEISRDHKTLWVHSYSDGSTVGRISHRGVDIHNSVTDMAMGMGQCKHCTHGKLKPSEWEYFRKYALENWFLYLGPGLLNLPNQDGDK